MSREYSDYEIKAEDDIIELLKDSRIKSKLDIKDILLEQKDSTPDLIIRKKDGVHSRYRIIKVEVETNLSNYFAHGHDKLPTEYIDEVWCWENDTSPEMTASIPYKVVELSEELKDFFKMNGKSNGIKQKSKDLIPTEIKNDDKIPKTKEVLIHGGKREFLDKEIGINVYGVLFGSEAEKSHAYRNWVKLYLQGKSNRMRKERFQAPE